MIFIVLIEQCCRCYTHGVHCSAIMYCDDCECHLKKCFVDCDCKMHGLSAVGHSLCSSWASTDLYLWYPCTSGEVLLHRPSHTEVKTTTTLLLSFLHSSLASMLICTSLLSLLHSSLATMLICTSLLSLLHSSLASMLICTTLLSLLHSSLASMLICTTLLSLLHSSLATMLICTSLLSLLHSSSALCSPHCHSFTLP